MYCGRFAPTPSGPLHLGSLVAALGSYLDARAHNGRWLVRIEDVDKPRAVPSAAKTILTQLEAHGLTWDGPVLYQSQRDSRYRDQLAQLQQQNRIYACDCSRRAIRARGDSYDGYCRHRQPRPTPHALRFINERPVTQFIDRAYGVLQDLSPSVSEDFILKRRDDLYAYQLAVVVDDIDQGVTDIVRGSDLITPSYWQLTLWQELTGTQPRMMHLPLVMDNRGRKLSKQNHAPPISMHTIQDNLRRALAHLNIDCESIDSDASSDIVLQHALQKWGKKWHKTTG